MPRSLELLDWPKSTARRRPLGRIAIFFDAPGEVQLPQEQLDKQGRAQCIPTYGADTIPPFFIRQEFGGRLSGSQIDGMGVAGQRK